ncbi:MAG: hypothetical protein IJ220_07105 [Clostridia bacterium]|nr:hypothetical protein [Clostridia bacterium]
MNKLTKRLAAIGAAMTMAVSMMSMVASAYNISETGVGAFEWYTTSAKITNTSTSSCYMESHINVYKDKTGEFVTSISKNATGGYNTYAKAVNSSYSSSNYNFEIWGTIYNSSSPMSGVKWSTGYKYLN